MKLRGRITLYGEYLMHAHTRGYCLPTAQWLSTDLSNRAGDVSTYNQELDRVRQQLLRRGLPTAAHIEGDLPLGAGFAASTVLALLHLTAAADRLADVDTTVLSLDRESHGFSPSGLDLAAVRAQSPGFYGHGSWQGAPLVDPPMLIVLPRAANRITARVLPDVRARVVARVDELVPTADQLSEAIVGSGKIDMAAIYRYCCVLMEAGIYDPEQEDLVTTCLAAGLAAKGIGGLWGKAMIVLGPPARLEGMAQDLRRQGRHVLEPVWQHMTWARDDA